MMTLTQKLTEYMNELEEQGRVLSSTPSTFILMGYYRTLDVTSSTTMASYMAAVSNRVVPAYESVTRAIRKSRELTPRWKKNSNQVEDEVQHTQDVVGYKAQGATNETHKNR